MSTARITKQILLGVLALLLGWDVVVATNKTAGDTISEIILALSHTWPLLPLLFGIVAGHLFWPQRERIDAAYAEGRLAGMAQAQRESRERAPAGYDPEWDESQ